MNAIAKYAYKSYGEMRGAKMKKDKGVVVICLVMHVKEAFLGVAFLGALPLAPLVLANMTPAVGVLLAAGTQAGWPPAAPAMGVRLPPAKVAPASLLFHQRAKGQRVLAR